MGADGSILAVSFRVDHPDDEGLYARHRDRIFLVILFLCHRKYLFIDRRRLDAAGQEEVSPQGKGEVRLIRPGNA